MIILIGPLPPPVHGAALITERVAESLAAEQFQLLLCSTSPGKIASRWQYHLHRVLAYIRCARTVLCCPHESTAAYLSLSGGNGLLYDLIIVTLARLRRFQIIFHHHSFSYLAKRSEIMRAIICIAGSDQLHIALCSAMAGKLSQLYGGRLRTEVISNLAFFEAGVFDRPVSDRPLNAIGYLSNISPEKGIDRFLDLMAKLRSRGSQLTARIAGPFGDPTIEKYVGRRIDKIGGIEYVGPVFDEAKLKFLSTIDLLVFPTRYVHEAEPLVIYEAQSVGAVVSASDRGCIAEMVPPELLLASDGSDIAEIADRILAWERTPISFMSVRKDAEDRRARFSDRQRGDSRKFRDIFIRYK